MMTLYFLPHLSAKNTKLENNWEKNGGRSQRTTWLAVTPNKPQIGCAKKAVGVDNFGHFKRLSFKTLS